MSKDLAQKIAIGALATALIASLIACILINKKKSDNSKNIRIIELVKSVGNIESIEKIERTENEEKDFLGKVHYNDGTIGSVQTSATEATLIIARNTGRQNLIITNTGEEEVYIWRRNYTGTTTASAEITRQGGFFLGGSGGSYETWDNEFLWIGDVWASTSSVPVTITFDEK